MPPEASASSTAFPGKTSRLPYFVAPAAAMLYPLLLLAFHNAMAVMAASGSAVAGVLAGICLVLAFLAPIVALVMAKRLSTNSQPTAAGVLARRVALLAVAAPPVFTFVGVVTYMLKIDRAELWIFWALWAALAIPISAVDHRRPLTSPPSLPNAPVRIAHGAVALALVLAFLAAHIANHLFGLAGAAVHAAVMKVLRNVYRQPVVEPLLVLGFLFQVVTGGYLAWRQTANVTDGDRTFQVASGIYLMAFIVGHLNAVFVYARTYMNIDSDWAFATGAPTGLIVDAWNIRLVPLYGLAVFFVLAHLAAGARIVLLAHGASRRQGQRVHVWGASLAAIVAVLILLGMCGVQVSVG